MDIDFLQGARLEDRLTVKTSVAEAKKASLIFCQEIVNPAGKTLCKAMVKVACIDNEKMRPKAIPQSIVMEFTHSDR